eukprot:SM000035S13160  [mRNA]  locus=s35:797997:800974:- [translate_table: standard]
MRCSLPSAPACARDRRRSRRCQTPCLRRPDLEADARACSAVGPPWPPPRRVLVRSSKEKPTLGGTRIKTRKRNIQVPLDPSSFANAIVEIYLDHNGDLDLIAKDIDSSELDFSRYGDTFFEVVLCGQRMQLGTTKPEEGQQQTWSVLNCEAQRNSVLPVVLYLQKILRRRPFMIKSLENVMKRVLQSLELYGSEDRKKLGIFTALIFSQKLSGLPPETVFGSLMNDTLVGRGTVLPFVTEVFKEYLVENSLDDLIALLRRAKMEERLLDFFPLQKRTPEAFAEHFDKEGLHMLVEYNKKKVFDVKLQELRTAVVDMVSENAPVQDVIDLVKQRRKEGNLPDLDIVRILWDAIMDAVQWSGKNQQQNINAALRQVKNWGKVIGVIATTTKLEMELMYKVQIQCYEDAKLMKLFPEIVRTLYELDVLAEDTVLLWYRKGTNPKGRQVFVKSLEPFVNWLEQAEEED